MVLSSTSILVSILVTIFTDNVCINTYTKTDLLLQISSYRITTLLSSKIKFRLEHKILI